MDVSVLDAMGAEEFISLLKYRTDNNQKELWKEVSSILHNLKSTRDFIHVQSTLFQTRQQENNNIDSMKKYIERLVDAARVIFDVERVNVLEIDIVTDEFILTYSSEKQNIGLRFLIKDGIECNKPFNI
jgi:hypothetical protein